MTAGSAATPLRHRSTAGEWLTFLQEHVEPSWRQYEWDPTTLVFTGDLENPATIAYACQTPGCTARSIVKQGQCVRCRTAKARGKEPGPTEPFAEVLCGTAGVPGCALPFVSNGLCHHHRKPFRSALHRNPRLSVATWAKGQTAYAALGPCAIAWCDRQRRANVTCFCKGHYRLYRKSRSTDESAFAATVRPPIASSDFSLADCSPTLAAEVIYGLQCRDQLGLAVNPFYVRDLITLIQGAPTLASVKREGLHPKAIQMLDNLEPFVDELHDRFTGRDVFSPDLWGPHVMMRFPSSKDDRHTVRFAVDWTLVECDWLRKAGKLWARDTLPRRQTLAPAIGALRHVSDALKGSPGYHDRQRLGLGDITAIAQHISTLNVGGSTMVYSKSSQYLGTFRVILRHCRDAGYLADVPTPFAFMKMHEVKKPKSSGDEPGRAIPDSIIELLDANLATFKPNYPSSHRLSGWSNDDYGLMWQTIYVVLRDSGRRPGEITNLRYDCLTTTSDDEPILKWDNQKAKRPGRRLPIFTTTARAIQAWQQRLRELTPTVKGRHPLFPSPSTRAEELNRPTQATYFGTKFGTWVDSITTLEQHLANLTDQGTPFSRPEIVLYGFRHAYAQSLADAGTPPDVLRQLMDHLSGETTSGYYRIGQKRKRDAIDVMSKLRSDIYGKNRPIGDLETYQRTEVATVLGGCSEPTNVKAGGKSCPIRFQCGACSFYRPDPTYVPEIEDEIRRLRKDIATAELCATSQVVENLEYNLGMLQAVLRKMHDNLATLTPQEQAVYEVFHAEARKSRRLLRLNLTAAEPGPGGG